MSVDKKQGSLRKPQRGQERQGMSEGLQRVGSDGIPWAVTPTEAAKLLSLPLKTVVEFMRIGWLRPIRPGRKLIPAFRVRRLMSGRPY